MDSSSFLCFQAWAWKKDDLPLSWMPSSPGNCHHPRRDLLELPGSGASGHGYCGGTAPSASIEPRVFMEASSVKAKTFQNLRLFEPLWVAANYFPLKMYEDRRASTHNAASDTLLRRVKVVKPNSFSGWFLGLGGPGSAWSSSSRWCLRVGSLWIHCRSGTRWRL